MAVSVNIYDNARANLLQDFSRWSLTPQWRWAVGSPSSWPRSGRRYYAEVDVTTKHIAGTTVHYLAHSEMAYVVDPRGYERDLFALALRRDAGRERGPEPLARRRIARGLLVQLSALPRPGQQRERALRARGKDVVGAPEHEDERVDPVVDGVGDRRVCGAARRRAFIASRVVTKSSIVRWSETKWSPAWPPSTVLKSRRMISGLPLRRARAEVCACPITP